MRDVVRYALLAAISVVILFPFAWLFVSSFKENVEILGGNHFFPKHWTIQNYVRILTEIPMLAFFRNSMIVSVFATAGSMAVSAMAAFVFAKLDFRGKHALFVLVLGMMMVPWVVTMIPVFIVMKTLGLIDTLWALILPAWTGSAFAVFFLRQHMMSVPHDLYESARMEGCSPFRIFASVYLPLVRPALATLVVLHFIWYWNDLLGPLIYLNSPHNMTVTVGISYFRGQYVTDYPVVLAGVFLSLIPTSVVFLAAQKHLVKGMLISGLK